MKTLRVLSMIIASVLLILSLAACGDTGESGTTQAPTEAVTDAPETKVTDKFAQYDLADKTIRIFNSTNIPDGGVGMSSSNKYIEGEEISGDIVCDEVFRRNNAICDLLNVNLEYSHVDLVYSKVYDWISVQCSSGDDWCDVIINDQYGLVRAAINNYLYNINDTGSYESYFDFEANGWYSDYMSDLTIGTEKMYILAGDYFIDTLRNAHALYFNTAMYTDIYGSPNELYAQVENFEWTYDQLLTLVQGSYSDDGDGVVDTGDRFGIIFPGAEGSLYPFIFSSEIRSVEFDANNIPSIVSNLDKQTLLCETIMQLYNSSGANFSFKTTNTLSHFTSGGSLFVNYYRIGDLEDGSLRNMDDVGLVPYPMLDEAQGKYFTTVHDTAELGAVPCTCRSVSDVSLVLQFMAEYTAENVLPTYYEVALKLKYVKNEASARMVDYIRDGITSPFELAYGYKFGRPLYVSVRDSVNANTNILTSTFKTLEKSSKSSLEEFIAAYTGGAAG